MHDFPATALTRADLPSSVLMAKVAANSPEDTMEMLSKDDPALDSEGLSIASDSTMEADPRKSGLDVKENLAYEDANKPVVPQPVTPDGKKVAGEMSPALSSPQIFDGKKAKDVDDSHGIIDSAGERASAALEKAKGSAAASSDGGRKGAERSSNSRSRRSRSQRYEDDASSSDDDSYFAKHLPSPKSGRSFSYSSAGSAGAVAAPYNHNNTERESDASLSFSDESDDDMHHPGVHISPMIHPKGMVADMNLYPQRITRMHSVSSLVSSASSEDEKGVRRAHRSPGSSVSSYATSGTSSDPGLKAEFDEAGIDGRPASQFTEVSGRKSPVMGQHGVPGYFYSSPSPVMSPPPIMQGYVPEQGISHPQPISHEQMAAWVHGGPPSGYSMGGQAEGYGATLFGSHEGGFRNVGKKPYHMSSSYVDEVSGGAGLINHLAGGPSSGSGQDPFQSSRGDGGRGSNGGQMGHSTGPGQEASSEQHTSADVDTASAGQEKSLEKMPSSREDRGFKVYMKRWLMLLYMSILNLLSDWTCYSVAPISLLTEKAFGDIDPELLVTVFLGANAVASISEPVILSRLGLRRTVLFGSLLLMIGSIIKSGGVPPILQSDITEGESTWRLYLGFFLVGLSQPLYQCTPTLLSSSWFPEEERTMATGVALNANQLGIGFAFVFGTLLVADKTDIIPYFGLLSTISTVVFMGALIQFDDAPPTPPSASARVMRGTFDVNLPSINTIVQSVRGGFSANDDDPIVPPPAYGGIAGAPSPAISNAVSGRVHSSICSNKQSKSAEKSYKGSSARRRTTGSRSSAIQDSGRIAPSSALPGSTSDAIAEMAIIKAEASQFGFIPPSPMMPGKSGSSETPGEQKSETEHSPLYQDASSSQQGQPGLGPSQGENPMYPPGYPGVPPGMYPPGTMPPPYQYPYWDPRFIQQMQQQQAYYQQQYFQQQHAQYPPPPHPYHFTHSAHPPPYLQAYDYAHAGFPMSSELDEGAEPIITITPHHLDIDIRDDQVIRSLKACFARPGFIHALVAFTASGIVINTLSTYMDYLVRLNGAPRTYTGIVGGTFQFLIMISSLIIGKFTDHSRAYYSVTIGMLVLGAFGLAECGVSLDSDRGDDLRVCLVVVAVLVGPLQPVSTELGVDVVYPLSENTVLVIQQLFSNLLSALFIPVFKALKDVGSEKIDDTEMFERPQYTFSFYLLIVIHTVATVFFATFNGKYLRYEHELERKAEEEEQDERERQEQEGIHPFYKGEEGERQPLISNPV